MSLVGLMERAAARRQEQGPQGLFPSSRPTINEEFSQPASFPLSSPYRHPANVRSAIEEALRICDEDF